MNEENYPSNKKIRLENLHDVDAILEKFSQSSVANTIASLGTGSRSTAEDLASLRASNAFLKIENERKDVLIEDLLRKLNNSIELIQQQAHRLNELKGKNETPQQQQPQQPPPLPISLREPPKQVTATPDAEASNIRLVIRKQPPSRAIYQRILRPFPVVEVSGCDEASQGKYFVEVSLLKKDNTQGSKVDEYQPVTWFKNSGSPLEGDREKNLVGGTAVFRKLKILTTSSQQGAFFVLKFTLKKYSETVETVPDVQSVISNPIEVFSHTLYLKGKDGRSKAAGSLNSSSDTIMGSEEDQESSPEMHFHEPSPPQHPPKKIETSESKHSPTSQSSAQEFRTVEVK